MSDLPDFPRLVPFGARIDYLMWASNVKEYLFLNNLWDTIVQGTECSGQQKAQALLYMRRHLNEDFRYEYNLESDPCVLWQSLKDHFDRMKAAKLPQAKSEWQRLYFSDFGSVTAYGSVLRRIVTRSAEDTWPRNYRWGNDFVYVPAKSAYASLAARGGKLRHLLQADFYVIASRERQPWAHEKALFQSN